jgi:DNA-binding SARP family transcriptional activator
VFRLVTFGTVALQQPDGTAALGAGVPLAILTYLHASPGRSATREHLASTFWATSDQSHSRQALRQNLTRLRNLLGPDAFVDDGTELRLACPLASDLEEFHEALRKEDLNAAVAAYTGPFFPEYGNPGSADFEHWLDGERERLRNLFLRAGERLVRRGLDRGRPREVLNISERMRREAPESESARRLHLEVLIEDHDSAAAQAEASEILGWLEEEGREPEPATSRLIRLARRAEIESESGKSTPALLADLVGRSREFSRIVGAWSELARGPARSLHLEARAGLGKSRLLEEAAGRIRNLGGRIVSLRAQPGDRHLDSSLAADLAFELAALPGAKAVSAPTAELLVGMHPALSAVYPKAVAQGSGADRLQMRALALGELLASVAEEAPLALFVDDVHWLDQESRRLVGAAVNRLGKAHVLVVTAGRPGGDSALGTVEERILLGPLTLSDTEELLASLGAFADPSLGRRLGAALHRASGGSPLLMLESVQSAIENDKLASEDGVWKVPDPDALIEWLSQRNALELRLKSLSPGARDLLLRLAATGVPLARQDLERAMQSGALSGDTLSELERRGYVSPKGDRWDLAHDEIGETMLRLAPEGARKAAHAGLGRALLERGSSDTLLVRRAARHLVEAGSDGDLGRVFRGWVGSARARGDWTAGNRLAIELLGDLATPARVGTLVRGLPAGLRWPLKRWAVLTVGAAIVAAIVIALLLR